MLVTSFSLSFCLCSDLIEQRESEIIGHILRDPSSGSGSGGSNNTQFRCQICQFGASSRHKVFCHIGEQGDFNIIQPTQRGWIRKFFPRLPWSSCLTPQCVAELETFRIGCESHFAFFYADLEPDPSLKA